MDEFSILINAVQLRTKQIPFSNKMNVIGSQLYAVNSLNLLRKKKSSLSSGKRVYRNNKTAGHLERFKQQRVHKQTPVKLNRGVNFKRILGYAINKLRGAIDFTYL